MLFQVRKEQVGTGKKRKMRMEVLVFGFASHIRFDLG